MANGSRYSNIAVTQSRLFRPYHRVSCDCAFAGAESLRLYEDFRTKEEAEFWAQALKDGKWEPLDQEATKELRERIEHG
ncbi:hypothetical protein [Corynebacterium stationis]|uniref:hypothetical protein n=1 Tax=Corynebacterium stationis TaxID=1705 RepID=UPI0028A6FD09|nr:hypothetical protein [Corynebacterium stationis]